MPARSKAQLAKAYANRGEPWAEEMIRETKDTEGLPERVKKRRRRVKRKAPKRPHSRK